jgi:hypothetical protein
MSRENRWQRKCYFASAEYAESFWGKFVYIYQGKGGLRLTTDGLSLEAGPRSLEIPFDAIKSIGLGRFSSWAKPAGLEHLIVRYGRDGEFETIYLVPHESAFDPTWTTSELVESWFRTLEGVEELSGRIEPPQFDPVTAPFEKTSGLFAAGVGLGAIGMAVLTWLLFRL